MNELKSTGVIRRIDELGRIVIPKEIRRHLSIREGENLEIFTEENKIVLKKYSKILEYADFSSKLCDIFSSSMNFNVIITDRDKIVTSSKSLGVDLDAKELDTKLLELIQNRESYESSVSENMLISDTELEGYIYIYPIISSIDCLGLIMFVKNQSFSKEEKQFAKFLAAMIANKIDIS